MYVCISLSLYIYIYTTTYNQHTHEEDIRKRRTQLTLIRLLNDNTPGSVSSQNRFRCTCI